MNIYTVLNGSDEMRLVRAQNKAQAIRHCAKSVFRAELAKQDTLVALISKGIKVEDGTAAESHD